VVTVLGDAQQADKGLGSSSCSFPELDPPTQPEVHYCVKWTLFHQSMSFTQYV